MSQDREAFEAQAQAGPPAEPGDATGFAARVLHAAAAAPERIPAIYDAAAEAWLGRPIAAAPVDVHAGRPEPIPETFWPAFWALIDEPPGALGAEGVTLRTAALAGLLAPGVAPRSGRASLAFPGCAEAVAQGWPQPFTLAELATCLPGSLGGAFHALIVDNGFDLEVLDRDALGLADLPPPLDYLNARILQCHDLWHIVGGYRTTGLHEVAISAFQAGQFGHHYSAMFLAVVLAKNALHGGAGAEVLLDTILAGWAHGRETPPLLPVDWPAIWDRPLDEVRSLLGVSPFASPWPAELFEQLAAA